MVFAPSSKPGEPMGEPFHLQVVPTLTEPVHGPGQGWAVIRGRQEHTRTVLALRVSSEWNPLYEGLWSLPTGKG